MPQPPKRAAVSFWAAARRVPQLVFRLWGSKSAAASFSDAARRGPRLVFDCAARRGPQLFGATSRVCAFCLRVPNIRVFLAFLLENANVGGEKVVRCPVCESAIKTLWHNPRSEQCAFKCFEQSFNTGRVHHLFFRPKAPNKREKLAKVLEKRVCWGAALASVRKARLLGAARTNTRKSRLLGSCSDKCEKPASVGADQTNARNPRLLRPIRQMREKLRMLGAFGVGRQSVSQARALLRG